jgi:hypothetical protein
MSAIKRWDKLWESESESESYITMDGQSVSLSWNKAPIWGLRPDLYYCLAVTGLLMWGALSDERTGLSFTIAAGPRQCSYFRVRVPWDSWPYFTVSDSRLTISSPPTTRRATVEVFDPASTRDKLWEKLTAYFLWYDTDLIENDASNNTSLPRERIYRFVT